MHFTYKGYSGLLEDLKRNKYCFATYHDWRNEKRCVILRHDIDTDISKALKMAQLEKDRGVHSTYFVLVTSDFYNIFSIKNSKMLKEIISCGHEIGLHFDEVRYPNISLEMMKEKILQEAKILEQAVEVKVSTVSMHRPSKTVLDANLEIPGIINSYGNEFFKGFKYLSDSRRHWREPVEEIIKSQQYERLHILTHAFWYNDIEKNITHSVNDFIIKGNTERYNSMAENITDIDSIISKEMVK